MTWFGGGLLSSRLWPVLVLLLSFGMELSAQQTPDTQSSQPQLSEQQTQLLLQAKQAFQRVLSESETLRARLLISLGNETQNELQIKDLLTQLDDWEKKYEALRLSDNETIKRLLTQLTELRTRLETALELSQDSSAKYRLALSESNKRAAGLEVKLQAASLAWKIAIPVAVGLAVTVVVIVATR